MAGSARALAGQLMMVPGGVLQAAYVHGSAALGGWVPGRSDVDMLFVVEDGISSAAVTRMGEVLCASAGGCAAANRISHQLWMRSARAGHRRDGARRRC